MKRLKSIIVLGVVALVGYGLYSHANLSATEGSSETNTASIDDVAASRPIVAWSVRAADGTSSVYTYSLATGETSGPSDRWDGPRESRINQSSNLCNVHPRVASGPLRVDCDGMVANSVLAITDKETDAQLLVKAIDVKSLGITTLPDGAYLVPIGVSDDKTSVYLAPRVEGQSWIAGLWVLDVATGDVSEISYVREHAVYEYEIDPTTKRLFGVSYQLSDDLNEPPTGSDLHWVDLVTGNGDAGDSCACAFGNPMLGDDGAAYAFYASGGGVREGTTVFEGGEGAFSGGSSVEGVAKDWFGDTMVFDRDGNLFLYDLKTKTETPLTYETDATVEYLGVLR